jgi:predicted enzyme related to lactoylglutathione lyase
MTFLEHVTITVPAEHWQEALAFYQSVMGLHVALSADDGKQVLLDGGQGAVLGLNRQDDAAVPPENHLGFVVGIGQWDELIAALKQAGTAHEKVDNAWTGSSFTYFHDPAGTRIQLLKRPKPMIERFRS